MRPLRARLDDPERDQFWNPALPALGPLPASLPPTPPESPPPIQPPPIAPAAPAPVAAPHAAALMAQKPPASTAQQAPQPRPAPPKPQGDAAEYDPDFADYLYGALAGFGGNFQPSARERRWSDQQNRQRQAQQDEYNAWLASEKARRDDATAARQERANTLAEGRLSVAEANAQTARDRFEEWRKQNGVLNDPNHPQHQAMLESLRAQGVDTTPWEGLALGTMKMQQQPINEAVGRAHAAEDTALDAKRAGAMAGAATSAREHIQEGYNIRSEDRAEKRAERASTRQEEREGAVKVADAERKRVTERVSLEALKQKLAARAASEGGDSRLPMQGSVIERGAVRAKANLLGGTGMNAEDSLLDNDLTAAGLQSYMNTAGNAPNSEREQTVAARAFRGDGTYAGAIKAIDERLRKIDAEVGAMRGKPKARAASSGDDEWEDL